jgi:hypothetical protein
MSPSSLPLTILSSPRLTHVTAPRWPTSVAVHRPSSSAQSLTMRSWLPVMSRCAFASAAAAQTPSMCPKSMRVALPVPTSHAHKVLSRLPDTSKGAPRPRRAEPIRLHLPDVPRGDLDARAAREVPQPDRAVARRGEEHLACGGPRAARR